ncbi:MAG: hypothetical protein ACTSU5_08580 [Promethearchaeota archaeon]
MVIDVPKDGTATEREILSYLDSAPGPRTAYDIQKGLNYSPGKVQSALRRLVAKKLIVKKSDWDATHRRKRVVVWTRDFTPSRPTAGDVGGALPDDVLRAIDDGDPFSHPSDASRMVVPVVLSRFEAELLAAVPAVNRKYKSLTHFVEVAITTLLKKQTNRTKVGAVKHLVDQGVVTQEEAAGMLGTTPEKLDELFGGVP